MEKTSEANREDVRFQQLLPFYVNGTLTGEDRAWFLDYIASNPQSQTAIRDELLWARHVKGAIDAIYLPATEAEHIDRVYEQWQKRQGRHRWFSRLRQTLVARWRVPVAWIGAGSAAVIGQFVIIVTLLGGGATVPMRGGLTSCQTEPLLRLSLSPDATWHDVVLMLRAQGWALRNGPTESGQIWVSVPVDQTAQAAQEAASRLPLVESSEVSPVFSQLDCK